MVSNRYAKFKYPVCAGRLRHMHNFCGSWCVNCVLKPQRQSEVHTVLTRGQTTYERRALFLPDSRQNLSVVPYHKNGCVLHTTWVFIVSMRAWCHQTENRDTPLLQVVFHTTLGRYWQNYYEVAQQLTGPSRIHILEPDNPHVISALWLNLLLGVCHKKRLHPCKKQPSEWCVSPEGPVEEGTVNQRNNSAIWVKFLSVRGVGSGFRVHRGGWGPSLPGESKWTPQGGRTSDRAGEHPDVGFASGRLWASFGMFALHSSL